MAAIDALNGTMFKGRQLAVELSKAQPLINQIASGNSGNPTTGGNYKSILSMQLHVESSMQPCSHNFFAPLTSQVDERVFFPDHLHP